MKQMCMCVVFHIKLFKNEMNDYDSDCLELRKNFIKLETLFDIHLNVFLT